MRGTLTCLLLLAMLANASATGRVENLRASQDGGRVVLDYALLGVGQDVAEVLFAVSRDGGRSWERPKGVSGDVGKGVIGGWQRRIIWSVLKDYPDGLSGGVRFRVTVADAIPPLREPTRPGERQRVAVDASGFWEPVGPEKQIRDQLGGGIEGPEMVYLEGGCFQMGSPDSEWERVYNERHHQVCLEPFWVGRHEVTQAVWEAVTGENNAYYEEGGKQPMENVSWLQVQEFIDRLNELTGRRYRLPTEAEWEYAARGGTETRFWWGDDIGVNRANCDGCGSRWDDSSPAPIGSFPPNPWGIYDTVGNVWEWTCSTYDKEYGGDENACADEHSESGARALRGGSSLNAPWGVRSAYRHRNWQAFRHSHVGFRLAIDAGPRKPPKKKVDDYVLPEDY